MAAKEMYDYLDTVTPDNNQILTLAARGDVRETGFLNQTVFQMDDGSRKVATLATKKQFYLDYPFNALTESDAGTVIDAYFDGGWGNGRAESFKLQFTDGHTYVVMFDCDMPRTRKLGDIHQIMVTFAVIGRIAD